MSVTESRIIHSVKAMIQEVKETEERTVWLLRADLYLKVRLAEANLKEQSLEPYLHLAFKCK